MAESTSYVGVVSGLTDRSTYQKLTSTVLISKAVQWACFNKNPFMQMLGLEGFGVDAMKNLDAFGAARPTGRIIRYDTGHTALSGSVFATAGTNYHVGRFGEHNPELVEGGDEWAYAWHEMWQTQFIPVVDTEDNTNGLIDIKAQKMAGMKQKFVEGVNYCLLGHASAPDYGSYGPNALYSDLPNLISVTQTRTVGAIATTNSYWQNGYKAIATIGGGGENDRPIVMRRSMEDALNDQAKYAEGTDDYALLATQGFWQYYGRLMIADSLSGGNKGAFGTVAKYDAAGIKHYAFSGHPMVWDPAVTVPYGATASTECCYCIHIPAFFVSIRTEANFKVEDWEGPRTHDRQKTLVAAIRLRYTPGVSGRRTHVVFYNLPANPD